MTEDNSQPTQDAVDLDLLAPLRTRYASWLGLRDDQVAEDREEHPQQIRAMQLILRMERDRPPSWHSALRLAASGAARICLDRRTAADAEWAAAIHQYACGHIRKVTRRGRGAQWTATADLPGITLSDLGHTVGDVGALSGDDSAGSTEIRVLRPGLVSAADKRVSKLQVGGTDAPIDDPPRGESDTGALRVWVPAEPLMTLGKTMAQAGHAGMIAAALLNGDAPDALRQWASSGCPADARRADHDQWAALVQQTTDPAEAWLQHRMLVVRDAGFTEIAPGTVTVIAQAPAIRS